jgi:hypothetical protein
VLVFSQLGEVALVWSKACSARVLFSFNPRRLKGDGCGDAQAQLTESQSQLDALRQKAAESEQGRAELEAKFAGLRAILATADQSATQRVDQLADGSPSDGGQSQVAVDSNGGDGGGGGGESGADGGGSGGGGGEAVGGGGGGGNGSASGSRNAHRTVK